MPKATSFEIPVDDIKTAKSPGALRRKIAIAQNTPRAHQLSRNDLSQKLDSAASRKQAQESDRVAKAAAAVEHAQAVARSSKAGLQSREDLVKDKIAQKLESAASKREAESAKQADKVGAHLGDVKARFLASSQDLGSPGGHDIAQKLQAAEDRRQQQIADQRAKLGEHFARVEEIKRSSPNAKVAAEVKTKLKAAESRRSAQEQALQAKLASSRAHADAVRENKKRNKGARSQSTDDLIEAQRLAGAYKVARG